MIVYIDSTNTIKVSGSTLDQKIPVSIKPHMINVNGWAGTNQAHTSDHIPFVRKQ